MKQKSIFVTLLLALVFAFSNAWAQERGVYDATTMGELVVNLETAPYGQDTPYNSLCPNMGTVNAKTGCGPTAFTILCQYHKWPETGVGTSEVHQGEAIDFSTHTYDYDNMRNDNYPSGYTEAQANAVAMMMRDFGWAHKVTYGSSVTEFSESIKGLKTYFSYNNSRYNTTGTGMDAMYRSDVGDEKFIETLKACLDEGLPIPFSALSIHPTTKEDNGRHIFILDGYTENNYFHFNFGWNGMGNGWYKLDNVQPDDESDYSTQQRAYPWITPTRTSRTVTASVSPAGAGSVTVNGNSSPAMVTEGTYATLTATANSGYTFSHWSKNGTQVGAEKTLKTKVEAEGNDYVANFLAVGTTRVNVSVSYNSNYGTVTQNGNAISGTGLTPYQNTEVTLVATPLDGYVFNGWTVTVGTTSTKYTTTNLTFVAKENASVYADFSLATQINTIDLANGTLTNDGQSTSKFSQWAAKDNFTNLKLNAAYNGTALNAISTTKLYAGGYDANSNPQIPVTYTISVDEKYVITSYSISYTASSADVTVTANGAKMARSGQVFAVTDVNSNRTSFVVNSTNAQHNIEINSFTVETKVVDGESSGTVTPTTYTISVTATEGGSAYVGTGTSTTVTAGNSVMLAATANNGYTFDGWYNGTNRVSTDLQYTFTPTASGSYQARFTANATPDQPTIATNLAGKYFRLKTTVNDAAKYLNVADNNPHTDGGNGGVSVATLNESSNAQIFYFEASGDGYKLKDKNGYYIKGQEWNVDANTTNAENASVLLFEETTTANEYYIKWNNTTKGGIRYFKVGASSTNANNYYPYGDEADKTKAAVWVLEEVVYYTITATAGEGGSVSPATSTVEEGNSVTLTATASTGYYFVNWTKNGVEVSTDATYSFTATEITSLVANFEQIVVNVTLTDAQGNTYNVQLSGFTTEITEGTVAAKLTEKYPYITLGDNATLDNAAYTYSNKVTLPFKVSSVSDATKTYWHNIYYPSNNTVGSKPGCPNYIAAFNNDDDVVDMAASGGYAYGADPTYNTKAGNPKISWAVYSVKNSFEFVFKNELTNKYIKVGSVSSSTTNNVKFVENAEDATTFTLLEDTDSYNGDYALVAKVGEAEGYLCATSSSTNYVTCFSRTNHQGAWVKFVEAPDYYSNIMDLGIMLGYKFGAGDGKYIITDAISEINDRIANNSENITLNTIKQDSIVLNSAMNNWPAVRLTINPVEGGTTNINGEENVVHKYVPNGYELPLAAVPAVGYHFVSWTDGTSEVETAEYTKTISGTKGDVIALTANFAKDTYTINVSTNGTGGSAMIGTETSTTVEHGASVTINAVANDGYKFSGWYNGEEFVSAEANYTFTVTSHINYTARFEEEAGETPTTHAIHIVTVDANGNTLANNATGPVKAVINIGGSDWVTDKDFDNGATAYLVATSDFNQSAYLFDGWYKNGVLVSMKSEITVTVTEAVTYQARFVKGCVVTLASDNKSWGYPNMITYPDGSPVVGAATELKAVVKPNEEVLISITPSYGFRVANWTDKDGNEVAGKNANSFILEITGDNKYTAHIERATYTLSVSTQQGTMGEVKAEFGTASGTSVLVGHNMTATITATPYTGYKFVEWTTTDGTHISDENPYTVPAIQNVEDMVDVEYVAVFEEIEEVEAGTYYRIAYDFEVPVAAKSAATRAAGDVVNIDLTTGTFEGLVSGEGVRTIYSQWLSANGVRIIAEDKNNNEVTAMRSYNGFQLYINSLESLPIKYTIIVPEGYTLTSMKFKNGARSNDMTVVYGSETYSLKNDATEKTITFTEGNTSFTLSGTVVTRNILITALTMTENGGETPEPDTETVRYYMQSVACGVSGGNNLQNALKMTQETGAASIFYYTSNKLMSYATGTYVNENGGTRGLQNVGVEGGDVTFESNKIKFTNGTNEAYLHAVINQNGTSYVDHCGSNPDNHAANHNFVLEEVESLPVTITDAGYATWYAPVAVQLPDGLTAYTITIHGDYAITGEGFKQVPANTGVILEGTKGTTYELEIIDSAPEVKSIMEGTVAATYFPENDYAYVLSTDKGTRKLGFYMAKDGAASWSHKAYLPKSAIPADAQMSAGFRLMFGTTAIEEVEAENGVETIYDLAGRKLESISGSGIYIVNGKKVIVR